MEYFKISREFLREWGKYAKPMQLLFFCIVNANDDGVVKASVREIENKTGLSRCEIRTRIKRLSKSNIIISTETSTRNTTIVLHNYKDYTCD